MFIICLPDGCYVEFSNLACAVNSLEFHLDNIKDWKGRVLEITELQKSMDLEECRRRLKNERVREWKKLKKEREKGGKTRNS